MSTHNNNQSKYLCNLLAPHIPTNYNASDMFYSIPEINQLSTHGKIMALFDVESLFTNIPLDECIELVVKYIDQGNPGLMMSPTDFKTLFSFASACRD